MWQIISKEEELDVGRIIERVESVSQDDIARVAGSIFKNENMNLAVIGPVKNESGVREVLHL